MEWVEELERLVITELSPWIQASSKSAELSLVKNIYGHTKQSYTRATNTNLKQF